MRSCPGRNSRWPKCARNGVSSSMPTTMASSSRVWQYGSFCDMTFAPGSKNRLTEHDLGRFAGDTLFDRIARTVCRAGCLPRKELYEAWEVARRVRRVFRGGRVVDLAGGHGLLAHIMLILDDSSPDAVVVDKMIPRSATTLHGCMVDAWPRLSGRIAFITGVSM